jgi:SAM-dependent methyltransferase
MAQNIYDDPAFFDSYSHLPRSVIGLQGAPEWPTFRAMLPDVQGLKIVDLGCGFGWFCRWARQQGAAHVLGIDTSSKMLSRAIAATSDDSIVYDLADLERVELPKNSFDMVFSSLTFHYIANLSRLYEKVRQTLVPGGRLAFSIEHPIFMAPQKPGWLTNYAGSKAWPIDSYFLEGPRTTDWLAPGVVKHHRTLSTSLTLLIRSGFIIDEIVEFKPSEKQIAEDPTLIDELQRPMFLLVAAHTAQPTLQCSSIEPQTQPS